MRVGKSLGQRFAVFATLAALACATVALAHENIKDRHVVKRVHAMVDARVAVETLSQMMSGRQAFDKLRAREARRDLIVVLDAIPSLFRREHSDPLSFARPDLWRNWDDFRGRAKVAEGAARRLNTRNLDQLKATLPAVISACLSCHSRYRSK